MLLLGLGLAACPVSPSLLSLASVTQRRRKSRRKRRSSRMMRRAIVGVSIVKRKRMRLRRNGDSSRRSRSENRKRSLSHPVSARPVLSSPSAMSA